MSPEEKLEPPPGGKEAPEEVRREQNVVWGNSWTIKEGRAQILIEDQVFSIHVKESRILMIEKEGSKKPPFIVGLKGEPFSVRLGHVRRTRPLLLRFPQPVRLAPKAAITLYTTYPVKPALFHEASNKERVKLANLSSQTLRKTYYGDPGAGVLCELHFGPAVFSPSDIPFDRFSAGVQIQIENRSEIEQEAGILLIDPASIDYYAKSGELCTNIMRFRIHSTSEGNIEYPRQSSLEGFTLVDAGKAEVGKKFGDILQLVMGQRDMEQGF